MPPNADPTPKELFTGDTSYHPLMHLHVGAGSSALTRWVGFIRPLTIKAVSRLKCNVGQFLLFAQQSLSPRKGMTFATATETRLIEFGYCRLEFLKRQFPRFHSRHN